MGSESWHFKTAKKTEAERRVKIGPLKHPPWLGCVANFVVCLKLGEGGCHPSMRVCCQSFERLPFQTSSNKSSTTAIGLSKLPCHSKDSSYKASAGGLPTPASPPMQMIQPKKNLGDSQTDHPEGLRCLRSVAKRNAKTLKSQLDLLKSNQKNGKCPGSKTDSKHVCLDELIVVMRMVRPRWKNQFCVCLTHLLSFFMLVELTIVWAIRF